MFVSVIVPCYNHAPYLQARIDSILNQTYQNFELILLDDLSPDNSAEILLSYKNHPTVSHCIINEKNSGSTFAQWNKGIELAKGDLVWIAESDDVADLNFLEKLVPQFEKNPNLTLAYCQSYRMDSEGVVTGDWKNHTDDIDSEKFKVDFTMSGLEYVSKYLIIRNTIPNASAVIFKKQTYIHVGKANGDLKYNGDWEIWSKIVSEGDIFYSSQKLNYFRYHATSVIANALKNTNSLIILDDVMKFRNNFSSYLRVNESLDSRYTLLINKNKNNLFKEINRNALLAIKERQYKIIIPTIELTLRACPVYKLPFVIFKLMIKLIYSFITSALTTLIHKKPH